MLTPELKEKFYNAAFSVFQYISQDWLSSIRLMEDDQSAVTPEQILDRCMDADRMNPSWSNASADGLNEDEYKLILEMYRSEDGRKELASLIDFSF